MESKQEYEIVQQNVEKVEEGIVWENFKPVFDSKGFAKAMRTARLTDHASVTTNQQVVHGIIQTYWTLSLAAVNDFARSNK